MDFGIKGKKAIVCAASKGLGRACALALAREGVELVITARTASDLEATAAMIRQQTGAKVTPVAGDISTEAGRAAALAACPEPDILVNNNGGPPHGDFREWGWDTWIKAVEGNMLTPIFMIKAVVDGMCERKFGRIVNITSASVKSPNSEPGHEQRRACGLDRVRCRLGAPGGEEQRHDQQSASGSVPDGSVAQRGDSDGEATRARG